MYGADAERLAAVAYSLEERLGGPAFAAAQDRGRAMADKEALAFARTEIAVGAAGASLLAFCPEALKAAYRRRCQPFLHGLRRQGFVARLVHCYAEVNALHPFREGNGRSQRAFYRQLAADAGWRTGWHSARPPSQHCCFRRVDAGDLDPLATMLDQLVTPIGEFLGLSGQTSSASPVNSTLPTS